LVSIISVQDDVDVAAENAARGRTCSGGRRKQEEVVGDAKLCRRHVADVAADVVVNGRRNQSATFVPVTDV
jgi:hypothetical protein